MRLNYPFFTLLLLLLICQPAHADTWDDFGDSFQQFIKKLDNMNTTAEREYTVDQLAKFHSDLYFIERKQQYLILMIENPGMIDNNLSVSLKALRQKANAARYKLKKISKKVLTLSQDIKKLRKQLYRSTHSKKSWPSKIRKHDIPDYHLEHYLLTEGRNAVEVTHRCRKILEEFLKTH